MVWTQHSYAVGSLLYVCTVHNMRNAHLHEHMHKQAHFESNIYILLPIIGSHAPVVMHGVVSQEFLCSGQTGSKQVCGEISLQIAGGSQEMWDVWE